MSDKHLEAVFAPPRTLKLTNLLRLLGRTVLLFAASISAYASDPAQNWVEVRSPHFTVLSNAGDREGRHVAEQFEGIRALFQVAFANIRVDFGKPTVIFAVKNEDSLKMFIPNYGLNKNAVHIAGRYHPTTDKNFAILRTDVNGPGVNAYHALYHEYTHAILRLNFRGLPLWLEEGLAEFYGNAVFENKQVIYGTSDVIALRTLQRGQLIPIATLVAADASSPLYNTQDHAGMFYSESWALVHYLSVAPEVRDKKLIDKFLSALQASDDPVEAANQSFGDMKKLADKLEQYAHQFEFVAVRQPLQPKIEEKDLTVRQLAPAEFLIQQAAYLLRSGQRDAGLSALHAAKDHDSKNASLYDELGYYHYLQSAFNDAEAEFDEALALDPTDAMAFFYKAHIQLRKSGYTKDATPQIQRNLERAIALAPDFAPAHAFLCIAYSKADETKVKAISEARRAMELEPGNLAYFLDLGRALLSNGRLEDAKRIADKAQKVATTSHDRAMAASFGRQVAGKESGSDIDAAENLPEASRPKSDEAAQVKTLNGQITELICGHAPEIMLTLSAGGSQTLLHVKDVFKVEQLANGAALEKPLTCPEWKDRKAKVKFSPMAESAVQGEVQSVDFQLADTETSQ